MARPRNKGFSERVELLRGRYEQALDLFTGEPITGDDYEMWRLIDQQRKTEAKARAEYTKDSFPVRSV